MSEGKISYDLPHMAPYDIEPMLMMILGPDERRAYYAEKARRAALSDDERDAEDEIARREYLQQRWTESRRENRIRRALIAAVGPDDLKWFMDKNWVNYDD